MYAWSPDCHWRMSIAENDKKRRFHHLSVRKSIAGEQQRRGQNYDNIIYFDTHLVINRCKKYNLVSSARKMHEINILLTQPRRTFELKISAAKHHKM